MDGAVQENQREDVHAMKHKQNNVLCVIDMQGEWKAFAQEHGTIKKIAAQIRLAKKKKWTIAVVEYCSSGIEYCQATNKRLMRVLGKYPHIKVFKMNYDGSAEILVGLDKAKIDPSTIYVCGCMTCVCVLQTVKGLRAALGSERVNVLADCCYDIRWSEDLIEDTSLRQAC